MDLALTDALDSVADTLLRAYRDGDDDAYLAHLAPDATLVLPGEPRHDAADAYRAHLRTRRVRNGHRVLDAISANRRIRHYGDTAVLTHDLTTVIEQGAGTGTVSERETIVFARDTYGFWVAVHVHRSPGQA